jgi:NAD(P)-dependent dehydrogenase (short-subunit alcohol dehydrogenase family)
MILDSDRRRSDGFLAHGRTPAMEFENRLIVITGGAGGIARETAQLLLAQGAELLLIDPSASLLAASAAELAGGARVRTAVSALESPAACTSTLADIDRPIYAWSTSRGSFGPMRWTGRIARCGMRRWPRI